MVAMAPTLPTSLRPRPASPLLLSAGPGVPGPRRATPSRMSPLRPVTVRPLFPISAVEKTKGAAAADEAELKGMPPEFYDEEWQARQRERTKEWHAYRQKEEAEEERITNEYREIGMRLKAYPQEEVRKARILVSSFIRAGEDVEEEIEKAADRGDLTELILMVIWNRLDVARRDDERDAIRSLDLLYRRVEAEILKSEATPAMRLLNELLNLHYGGDDDKWLKKCRKRMLEVFPREDPFTVVFPASFNMEKREGRIELPPQDDDLLLRVDFVREVDELLKEVQAEQEKNKLQTGYDPESVANMLKQQEKMQTIRQVESLLELASSLKW
ncbi:unnamed protein product [Urochloa decumbens]|uniref:Protein PALE CRESS, chloroplastic n=1 Tax=Urochloa decumbens TaxID=240449 RepID=A0ABC8WGN4_9POAL